MGYFGDVPEPNLLAWYGKTKPNTTKAHIHQLECGPMPNVMAALQNIGGALCESSVIPFLVPCREVWLTPAAGVPCSNVANIEERKTWT